MKNLKISSLFFLLVLILSSCGKEDTLEIKDDVKFNPSNTNVKKSNLTLGKAVFYNLSADLFVTDTAHYMVVNSSNLTFGSGGILALAFAPKAGETSVENGNYVSISDFQGLCATQSYLDAYASWVQNGANPNNQPTLEPDYYTSSNLSFTVSNIVKNTGTKNIDSVDPNGQVTVLTYITDDATIEISGNITTSSGTQLPVSAIVDTKIHRLN